MKIVEVIGRNIRLFRERMGISQDELASYLGVNRVMVSYYETGEREAPVEVLNRLADLFGIDLADLLEENASHVKANLAFAFRAESFSENDLKSIANFKKIVKNYLKISDLIHELK
ncbi:MAG: helix-turn-helix domain-containing protein [Bacteroidetes bacterium]|nr:helix-turn-helix domain-containing protein [Bacteroidota bacterium]MCK6612287.1 helix-turn-helix domain-containing protein [Bacteroidia bacterium]